MPGDLLRRLYPEEPLEDAEVWRAPYVDEDRDALGPAVYTSLEHVRAALRLAQTGPWDVCVDIGSGDGRFPVVAATEFGVLHAYGIEIDGDAVEIARSKLAQLPQDVQRRVTFLRDNALEMGSASQAAVESATVISLYLLGDRLANLEPLLLACVQRGARVVSICFRLPSPWQCQAQSEDGGVLLYDARSHPATRATVAARTEEEVQMQAQPP